VTPRTAGPLAAFFAFGAFWGAWGVLLPDVKERSGASVTQLGLALFFVALAALPAMLVTGRVADRLGARAVGPALVLFGIAVMLPGLAGSVTQLALSLTLVGAASGALDVAINVAASAVEVSGGRRIIQIAHALFSAGFLVAALLTGAAREAGAEPFPVLLGVGVLLLAVAALNRGHRGIASRPAERQLVFSRRLLLLGALCAVAFVVESGIENWSALFLETELDASPVVGGLGPGLFAAAMVAGRMSGQVLDVRLGDRVLLAAGAALAGVGLVVACSAPSIPVALVGFVLGGAGISVAAPTLFGAAGRGADETERGSAVASVTTVSYLGFLAGPPLIGAVSGAFDLRVGLAMLAGIAAVLSLASASLTRNALPVRRLQHPPRGHVP
jgi:MFS family permease